MNEYITHAVIEGQIATFGWTMVCAILGISAGGLLLAFALIKIIDPTIERKAKRRSVAWTSLASIILIMPCLIWVAHPNFQDPSDKDHRAISHNVSVKYDIVGEPTLGTPLTWSKTPIVRLELADGRIVTSGTVSLAENGEPTILDPVYVSASEPVPERTRR